MLKAEGCVCPCPCSSRSRGSFKEWGKHKKEGEGADPTCQTLFLWVIYLLVAATPPVISLVLCHPWLKTAQSCRLPLKSQMDTRDLLLPCSDGSGAVDLGTSSRSWLLLCPQ